MSLAYSATNPQEVVDATEDTPDAQAHEMKYALAAGEAAHQGPDPRALPQHRRRSATGAYGIYAASQVYFGKEPKDLTLAEAALLAGLVKAPTSYNPATATGYPQALERRDVRDRPDGEDSA